MDVVWRYQFRMLSGCLERDESVTGILMACYHPYSTQKHFDTIPKTTPSNEGRLAIEWLADRQAAQPGRGSRQSRQRKPTVTRARRRRKGGTGLENCECGRHSLSASKCACMFIIWGST